MKCKDCQYCKYYGAGINGGYHCEHAEVEKSGREYEKKINQIGKAKWFIGYNQIKTSLRWCPLKSKEEKVES